MSEKPPVIDVEFREVRGPEPQLSEREMWIYRATKIGEALAICASIGFVFLLSKWLTPVIEPFIHGLIDQLFH